MQTVTEIEVPLSRYEEMKDENGSGPSRSPGPPVEPASSFLGMPGTALTVGTGGGIQEVKTSEEGVPAVEDDPILRDYSPKTSFGEALLQLRKLYLRRGGKWWNWEEIEAEVAARRGDVRGE
jgi:hypothetical protein